MMRNLAMQGDISLMKLTILDPYGKGLTPCEPVLVESTRDKIGTKIHTSTFVVVY